MDFQDPGTPKPGAAVLAEMYGGGRKMPLLVTENYGRGRTAVLATGGTWRWQMNLPLGDPTHDAVLAAAAALAGHRIRRATSWRRFPSQMLLDDGRVALSAEVRGKDYQPVAGCARRGAHHRAERRVGERRHGAGARRAGQLSGRVDGRASRAPT